MGLVPDFDTLTAAYALTRRSTVRTPLLDSPALAELTGASRVWVKAENLQKAGSFKIRGAIWRLAQLSATERAAGVIAYSSGNFAQGLAAAGKAAGVPVTIVMPIDAPDLKRRATEAFGARVVLSDHGERPREEVASALARDMAAGEGLTLLHPFDDPAIVAGQAGVALETLEQLSEVGGHVDVVACPVGGGGLIGGLALAVRHAMPMADIFAVEPVGYNGMGRSCAAGHVTRVASGTPTICDALQATQPGAAPFAAACQAGLNGVTVSDKDVRAALTFAFERLKLVLEPSGAVALAAALSGALPLTGRDVLIIASGGNIALQDFRLLTAPERD